MVPVTTGRVERKLAAILAADVVGYSRLAGADEERTLARLRALRGDLIDPAIAAHHGRVVKRTGDGILIEFRSVVDAVRCAIEVQNGAVERNVGLPPVRRIEFRIGIHIGDVIEETDGDLMGDAVNIAARLEGIAEAGSIYLSEDAWRQVRDKIDETFADLGEQNLKNIARGVRAYRLDMPGSHRPASAAATPNLILPDKPSIAVLPFQNLSGGTEQEYFADGMVEDIITSLSRIHWLIVIARNSSFVYKGQAIDIKQVGQELGVRYVLEGSVRRGGNRLRITGQLIDAENGAHIWADRYDGVVEEVFDLQDKITEAVVGVIEPSVLRAEIERAKRKRPDNLGAYELYLQSLPYFASAMPDEAETGMKLLERALKLDPTYALAHASMSGALEARYIRGGSNPADASEGLRHARAALAYGSDDAMALGLVALPLLHLGHDFPAASGAIDRALALNPSCAFASYMGAHIHAHQGDAELAENYARRALRLSPFDPQLFLAYNALGMVRLRARLYDESASYYARATQANPRFSTMYALQAAALALAGRIDEAKSVARRVLELEPGFRIKPLAAMGAGFVLPEVAEKLAEAWRKAELPE